MDEQISQDKEVLVGKYKIKVVRELCISAASCIGLAPSTFELDDQGKAIILDNSDDDDESLVLAAQSCPTKAIIVTDAETGEVVWPV